MLAPSTHNTQPWLFRVRGSTLDLYADRSRVQPVVDPDQRELTISCGAALYIIRLTLARFGHDSRITLLPDPRDPDLLARVTLEGPVEPDLRLQQLYEAISAAADEPASLRSAQRSRDRSLPRASPPSRRKAPALNWYSTS